MGNRTLPIVISFRDRWYYIFTLEIGSLTSSSSAGPIQISEFLEPLYIYNPTYLEFWASFNN